MAGIAHCRFRKVHVAISVNIDPRFEIGEIVQVMASVTGDIRASCVCSVSLGMSGMTPPAPFPLAELPRKILKAGTMAMARFTPDATVHCPSPYRIAMTRKVRTTAAGSSIGIGKADTRPGNKIVCSIDVTCEIADGRSVGGSRSMTGVTGEWMHDGVAPVAVRLGGTILVCRRISVTFVAGKEIGRAHV